MPQIQTSFYKAPRYIFRKKNILNWIKKLEFKTFIDVGCGAGDLDCSIAQQGKQGKGIDFSEEAIKNCIQSRDDHGLTKTEIIFERQNALNLVGKETYDIVICCETLEHVKKDAEMIETLYSLSNRYVLISVPAKHKLFDHWDIMVGHYRRYEKKDLIALLRENDLKIIRFANYGFPFTDIVRYLRRIIVKPDEKIKKHSMEKRTKKSGINPVQPPKLLYKVNLEYVLTPLYWFSKLFNNYNFSEGYLVLCEKQDNLSIKK